MSSYRPNYDAPPPPPPPAFIPPLPVGPPPSWDIRGDAWKPDAPRAPRNHPPQSDFSFQSQDDAPQYPSGRDPYRPAENVRRPQNKQMYRDRRGYKRGGGREFRGRFAKIMPSDRPLLQRHKGGEGGEQMLGVNTDNQRYIAVGDISDSDEQEMDESHSDEGQDADHVPVNDHTGQEPPAKRRALNMDGATDGATDGDSAPKWSNPDPYSVLPPVDEVNRKRKDPVALIRKAIKPGEDKVTAHNQVAANDDFISFDDDVEDSMTSSQELHPESPQAREVILLDNPDELEDLDLSFVDDAFLGSRKRTYDDEIKPVRRIQNRSPAHPTGSLLETWVPREVSTATPWLDRETSAVLQPGFRLHREICDFFEFVRPQSHEQVVRQDLLSRLQRVIGKEVPDCTVNSFGSFAAGLYLPNADMDVVINSDHFTSTGRGLICQTKAKIHKFGTFIRFSRIARENSVEVIASAKVPIIKFVDRITDLKVDISFENDTGLAANDTFAVWKRQYPAMSVLVCVIKQFLMMRGLNEVQYGGLGGFSVTCLVISLLQNMPRVKDGSLVPELNLGEVLIEFLDFYGNRIDTSRTGIMMNPPGYFDKQAMDRPNFKGPVYKTGSADRLAIMDPNRPGNDISGGSKKVQLIFDRFARAHRELREAMRTPNRPSLLDWLLGGNYESFASHRARLLDIYDDMQRPVHVPGGNLRGRE